MTKSNMTVVLLALLMCLYVADNVEAQKPCPFRAPVGEDGLRKYKATKKVKPIYPEESLKNKVAGRVVVLILVDENGKVPETKVKESPDDLTGLAVVVAAKRWEFQPPPKVQGRQICYSSTLSFKFEIKDGKGKVVDDPIN
jgi:TonB family protein